MECNYPKLYCPRCPEFKQCCPELSKRYDDGDPFENPPRHATTSEAAGILLMLLIILAAIIYIVKLIVVGG